MRLSCPVSAILAVMFAAGTAFAQPMYTVQYTTSPPTIDGAIGSGEWDAADAAAGNYGLIRSSNPPPPDAHGNQFQMLWDADALYIVHTSNYGGWVTQLDPNGIDFGADNLNFYFDPNTDGEPNSNNPSDITDLNNAPDGYQIAINEYPGQLDCGGDGIPLTADDCTLDTRVNPTDSNATGGFFGVYTEAHVDTLFGNQAQWAGLRSTQISQNATTSGNVVEMRIPWTDFDALDMIDDGMGGMTLTGLDGTAGPSNNDVWYFQAGQITSDGANFLPAWSPTFNTGGGDEFFASRPHGELTFVGAPGVSCDFDGSTTCDATDINLLTAEIASGNNTASFDLTGDGLVDLDDQDAWLEIAGNQNLGFAYPQGDATLDGFTDVSDFNDWNANKFTNNTDWTAGNFNGDSVVDVGDFNDWNANKFTGGNPAVVPEPSALAVILLGVCLMIVRQRR